MGNLKRIYTSIDRRGTNYGGSIDNMKMITHKDIQFMELCKATAQIFSTCGKRQYAAIITDEMNRVVGMGYNGGPRGWAHCKDGACKRFQENSPSGSAYGNCIAIHAETNAIINSTSRGTILYVNGPPCWDCAKVIVNAGIKRLVYKRDESYQDWPKVHDFLSRNGILCLGIGEHAS